MAVTTKKQFPNAVGQNGQSATVFTPVGIQLNNQDDLDVYVTLSGGTRVLQLRQATGSTAQSTHPQVNNTDGLYFPAVSAGTTLYNYQLSSDNNTITFSTALPTNATVFVERRTRDADSSYTTFASGSTIRATDLNNSSTESNFTAQDARNKAFTIEGVLFRGDQPSTNFITSDHIVAGTIVTNDIADDSVNADKIPDDTINSEHYVDRSIDTQHIGAGQVTTNELASDAVTTIKITDGNVTRAKLEADIIDGTKLADNAVDSEHYTDGSIDNEHLSSNSVSNVKIQDNAINTRTLATNSVTNNEIAGNTITSDKLNPATVITSSEQATATTNDTSFLTSAAADARFFNISSGDTIKDGQTFPDNDTTIATTAAINDRIIDIVNDIGGFDIIDSEQHFPNTNPQGTAGQAAVLSIKAASAQLPHPSDTNISSLSGTTLTIKNANIANNADIIITGVTATIPQGFGFLVESTSTLHTYTFHRLVPNATEVTTVATISGNVTTVANNNTNVTTVAGIDSDVTTVAGIASDVTAVAANNTNITAVKNNETNINAVKNNATNINTVAGSNSAVNSVAGSITSVNTAASNLTAINKFGDTYQVAASNPTTDGGGNAVAEGDLYFNTSANRLKVYDGANWVDGVIASGGGAQTTGDTFTGDLKLNDNVKLLVGTGSDLEIFHHSSNGSFINDAGTSTLKLQTGGSTKLEIQSGGVGVTGNIVVSGNVDGRDVAADGSSLDNIEAGNIGTDVTNGNIKLTPNGTGVVEVRGAGGNDGTLQLNCSAQSHGIKLKSPPHSAGQSYTLTFPSSITNNGVLTTNSSGTLNSALLSNANVDASAAIDGTKISPSFTSDITITNTSPTINFVDSNHNPDYMIRNADGGLIFNDTTNGANRLVINTDGHIDIPGNLDVGNGIDVTGHIIASGDITANGGDLTVSGNTAIIHLTDTNHNDDFSIMNENGTFRIRDATNSLNRLNIDSSGTVDVTGNLNALGGLDVTGSITVTGTVDGRDVNTDGGKLDGIEDNATRDQTASEIKTLLQSDKLTSSEIATNAIGNAQVASNAVYEGAIQNNAVTANKIANNAVYTNAIQNDAVNDDKLSHTGVSAATYGSATAIPVLTVNAQGRISSASTATINSDVISTQQAGFNNRTLATGFNHIMAGPVTIASGQAITLSGTAKLTIIG